MQITTLGTSSGTPTKQRNVSATAVKLQADKAWILIDCGEGTQHRLLHTPHSLRQLSLICITHVHGDHCYGLPGLLASAQMAGRDQALTILCPVGIQTMLETVLSCSDTHISYPIHYIDVSTLTTPFHTAQFSVLPIKLSHRVESFAYQISERHVEKKLQERELLALGIPKGPLWGQLQQGRSIELPDGRKINGEDYLQATRSPRSVIIAGDNDDPQLLREACQQCQVLVHEATYTESVLQKVGPAPQHSSAERVAKMAQQAQLAHLVLTHFSPRYQDDISQTPSIQDIRFEAKQHYDGQLFLANDLDTFTLDKQGVLHKINA